ncbi:hypothetical protein ABFS83_14G244900 [Erythranthe nasuta]
MNLKWQLLRGPFMRRVVLRAFMLVVAVIILSFTHTPRRIRIIDPVVLDIYDECPFNAGPDTNPNSNHNLTGFFNSAFPMFFGPSASTCKGSKNLTDYVLKELMEKNFLDSNSKALCVGEGSSNAVTSLRHLGLSNAVGVDKHPFFSLLKRRFVYELGFEDDRFDFVFSGDLDRVSVPALLVLEIERVLRPGGIGAMLVGARRFYSGGSVRLAAPIASFLKSSDVVRLCGVESFSLIIFKKRKIEAFPPFESIQLPSNCPSMEKNMLSSKNKLVYINVGLGEFAKSSVEKLSKLYGAPFEVFVVDHKTTVLSSYVTNHGINFVYYPGLAGDAMWAPPISSEESLSAPVHEEDFDFVGWFNETVTDGSFVVMTMSGKLVEVKILAEMFKTGAICRVDELFLKCPDFKDCEMGLCGDCVNVLESLRKSGVNVHQW